MRRIQHRLDAAAQELLNEPDSTAREQLLRKVQKLERKKMEYIEKCKAKQYEHFLNKLENLDASHRMYAFWKEVKSTLGGKCSKNLTGVVRNIEGELSNSENSYLENWAAFYERLYSTTETSTFEVPAGE